MTECSLSIYTYINIHIAPHTYTCCVYYTVLITRYNFITSADSIQLKAHLKLLIVSVHTWHLCSMTSKEFQEMKRHFCQVHLQLHQTCL